MTEKPEFSGFSEKTLFFFRDLKKNNNRDFFEKKKADYEEFVLEPARLFVTELGGELGKISHDVNAIPKVDKSIFRIYRDIRFSKDKTPYKTHMALWFWDGKGKKMESSGYYFHLEPEKLMLGAGIHSFPKDVLKEFRESVIHPDYGDKLSNAVKKVKMKYNYNIWGRHYKKIPGGYHVDNPNSDFLLYNGLYTFMECKIPVELYSHDLIDFCRKIYTDMYPVHRWLYDMIERVK